MPPEVHFITGNFIAPLLNPHQRPAYAAFREALMPYLSVDGLCGRNAYVVVEDTSVLKYIPCIQDNPRLAEELSQRVFGMDTFEDRTVDFYQWRGNIRLAPFYGEKMSPTDRLGRILQGVPEDQIVIHGDLRAIDLAAQLYVFLREGKLLRFQRYSAEERDICALLDDPSFARQFVRDSRIRLGVYLQKNLTGRGRYFQAIQRHLARDPSVYRSCIDEELTLNEADVIVAVTAALNGDGLLDILLENELPIALDQAHSAVNAEALAVALGLAKTMKDEQPLN